MTGRPSGGRSPKRRRLSRSAEFERVYRQGRSKSNRFLVLYTFPRGDDAAADAGEGPRLGLSVSRRVGGAVDRTRVKRVLREAFWAEVQRLPEGSDYVVVARPDSRELAEREGMPGVRNALAELVGALTGADAGGAGPDTLADEAHTPSAARDDDSMSANSADDDAYTPRAASSDDRTHAPRHASDDAAPAPSAGPSDAEAAP